MTPSPIETRLRQAAASTRQAAQLRSGTRPDVERLVERTARRRSSRIGSPVAVGLVAAATIAVMVVTRPPSNPAPEILGNPTTTAVEDGAVADASADAEGRWLHAAPGDTVELDDNRLGALTPATGDPVIVPWGPEAADTVEAGITTHPHPDGTEETMFRLQGAVDQSGGVLVAPTLQSRSRGDLILVEPDSGTARLLDEGLTSVYSIVAVPAGGWIVSAVDDDGQAILLKVAPDGQTADQVVLAPSPPNGGGFLEIVGSEVWLLNSFESVDPDRGAQVTLVSDDGGSTLNSQVTWRPAEQAVPEDEFIDLLSVAGERELMTVLVDGERVMVDWVGAPIQGAQQVIPVRITDSRITVRPVLRVEMGVPRGDTTQFVAREPKSDILIVVTDDQAHVGRFEPEQTIERSGTMITSSPDGGLWHLTFDASAMTIREVLLPNANTDR